MKEEPIGQGVIRIFSNQSQIDKGKLQLRQGRKTPGYYRAVGGGWDE